MMNNNDEIKSASVPASGKSNPDSNFRDRTGFFNYNNQWGVGRFSRNRP